jgi:PKD repeat protein
MVRFSGLRARLITAPTVAALVVGGLIAPTLTATSASAADPVGVQQRTSSMPTADSLPTAQINGVVWTQLIVGNTVYVGGAFTSARPAGSALGQNESPRNNLMAYDLTTGNLLPFAPNMNAQVKALAASPDGSRLYVGGNFTTADGTARYRIAAYSTATGALITSWAPGVDYTVSAIVATADTVYLGGSFASAGGTARTRLAAFSASTGTLLAWAPTVDNNVSAMLLSPDGSKLFVGGAFTTVNGTTGQPAVVALDPTTGAMLPFATNTVVRNGGTNSAILALSTDGTSLFGGGYKYGGTGNLEGVFKADLATGAIQWIEDCHGDTYGVYASSSAVYQIGHEHYCGNVMGWPQPAIWNFNRATAWTKNATGNLLHDTQGYTNFAGTPSPSLMSWFPRLDVGTYTGKDQAAWSVTGNDSYVLLGGEFPLVNGNAQQGLARFAVKGISSGSMGGQLYGSTFKPTLSSPAAGSVRVSFLANWDRDDRTLTYKITRDNTVVYTTTVDSSEFERPAIGFLDTGLTPGTTYNYRLQVTDLDGNVTKGDGVAIVPSGANAVATNTYGQTVLSQGASLYLPMNETTGTSSRDAAGFNDANIGAGVTLNTGVGAISGDTAMTFSGATGGEVSTSGSLVAPNTFTESAWFKTTSVRGGRIIGFSDLQSGTSGHRDRQVYMSNTGKLSFGVWGLTQQSALYFTSANSYNDGQWHQVVASMGPNGMAMYVDGVKVGSRADVTAGEKYVGYWRVGGDSLSGYGNAGTSGWLAGSIDEVSVYPTVLTSQQINAQFTASGRTAPVPADAYGAAVFYDEPTLFWRLGESAGTVAADAAGLNPGTYQGTSTKGAAGAITGTTNTAVNFNLTSGFVSSNGSFPNPTVYSVEAWVKTTSVAGGKIIGFGNAKTGLSTSYDRHLYMQNDGKVVFGANSVATTVTSTTALNNGQWHHVVGTQGPAGMTLYVDGLPVGTNAQATPASYTGYWRVGGDRTWNSTSSYLNGTIDEAAVYPTVLSADKVKTHFQAGGGLLPNVLPTAVFTHTESKLTVNVDASTSTDSDGTIASYAWNFGDGTTATGVTASHAFAAAGSYPVTLTVTDNRSGVATTNTSVAVVANVLPSAVFTATPNYLTAAVDASASTDSDGTIAAYAWNFGDGTTGSDATTSHTFAAGTYTVTLTVTDNDGASSSTTQSVTAVNPPNVPPTASFTNAANHLAVSVDGTASTDPDGTVVGYAWDFGDGFTTTDPTVAHTYAAGGTYTVTLNVTDNQGVTGTTTKQLTVAPNAAPTAVIATSSNGALVNVNGAASTDSDGTIASYAWTFGDGGTATGATASHTYAAATGGYPVTLTVTDNDGVSSTETTTVTLSAAVFVNDQFSRTLASGWGPADLGGAWTVGSGAAVATISGGYGRMAVAKGGTRIASLPAVTGQTNLDLRVTVSLDKQPTGGSTMVSGAVRRTADGEYRLTAVINTAGSVTLQLVKIAGGVSTTLKAQAITGLTYTAGTDLNLRLLVTGTTTTALSAKAWNATGTEPAAWQISSSDTTPSTALQGAGGVALVAYVSGSATNAPVTAAFKALTVQAPSA